MVKRKNNVDNNADTDTKNDTSNKKRRVCEKNSNVWVTPNILNPYILNDVFIDILKKKNNNTSINTPNTIFQQGNESENIIIQNLIKRFGDKFIKI